MNWFTKKSTSNNIQSQLQAMDISATNFRFCYVYGFTQDPERSSQDLQSFGQLYRLVIGNTGGGYIPQSFHPYQLINTKGTSLWIAAYAYLLTRQDKVEMLKKFSSEGAVAGIPVCSSFTSYQAWPDRRLLPDENALFGTYAPFVIPFIVWNNDQTIRWDEQIRLGMATTGNASAYVSEVNQAIRFLMAEPYFVIGFDEFDDQQPTKLIDHFVNYLPALAR